MVVLNVDDDIEDRDMFCEALKAIDPSITCIQIESGIKALEYLAQAEKLPDYVFIDINMPKMDGYECVKEIRSKPGMSKLPIVMYSTTFNPKDQANFKIQGIKFLNKSSRFTEVVNSVRGLIYNVVRE